MQIQRVPGRQPHCSLVPWNSIGAAPMVCQGPGGIKGQRRDDTLSCGILELMVHALNDYGIYLSFKSTLHSTPPHISVEINDIIWSKEIASNFPKSTWQLLQLLGQ